MQVHFTNGDLRWSISQDLSEAEFRLYQGRRLRVSHRVSTFSTQLYIMFLLSSKNYVIFQDCGTVVGKIQHDFAAFQTFASFESLYVLILLGLKRGKNKNRIRGSGVLLILIRILLILLLASSAVLLPRSQTTPPFVSLPVRRAL